MSGKGMNFDEWMNKNHGGLFDIPHQRECYEAGTQSRQAEIDELRYQRDILSNKVNELQKRIGEALKEIENGIAGKHHISYITKILKGEIK